MKRFVPFFIFMLASVYLFSQSPRLVLHEEFTSSTCGPCVSANTKFKGWITQYPDIYTAIFYHVNWPSPGNDPMYQDNTADNGGRVSYYSVNSVPWAFVDGNVWTGNGNSLSIGTIQNRANVPSPFEIQVQQRVPATQDTIYLTTLIKATQSVTATMVSHNVVIEKNIHFASPPGTNGEKDFPNVMKKMLPTKDGTTLPGSWEPGDYYILETSWPYDEVYDPAQVAAISFIQNKTNKEVFQAANSKTDVIVMPYDNDLEAMEYSNVSVTTCSGKLSPVVKIRNNGNDAITAFEVKYQINSETPASFLWTGNLTTLQKTTIDLPEITFTPGSTNVLKIFTVNPNSVTDEFPKNDTLTVNITPAPATYLKALLILRTDNSPEQVSWDVKDSDGNIIKSGGSYTIANHTYRDTVYFEEEGCYKFSIYDAGGNGVCCLNGIGVYQLLDNDGDIIHQNNEFGSLDVFEFKMDYALAVEKHEKNSLQISPNPFHNNTTVSFSLRSSQMVIFNMFDLTGKIVRTWNAGTFSSGNNVYELEAGGLNSGIYVLQLQAGTEVHTRRVAIN